MLRIALALLVVFSTNSLYANDSKKNEEVKIHFLDLDIEMLSPVFDTGPTYEIEYLTQEPAEIIWQARAEVILMGASEIAFLRNAIRLASEKADLGGMQNLAAELRLVLPTVPRIRTILSGSEKEVLNMQYFEIKAKEVFVFAKTIAEQAEKTVNQTNKKKLLEQKKYLDSCTRMLQRAGMFYVRVGRSKAEACMLQQIYCKGYWTECDILLAQRIRDTTCALHGEYLISWFPAVKLATERWSAEKAQSFAGKNDMDAAACDAWLQAMKPIILESYGQEEGKAFIDKVYPNPRLRTLVWLLCARTMRCSSLNYLGTEPIWSPNEFNTALTGRQVFIEENLVGLDFHLSKMAIECCGVIPIAPAPIVEILPAPVPVPMPEVIQPSPCGGCGGGIAPTVHVMPSWCAPRRR